MPLPSCITMSVSTRSKALRSRISMPSGRSTPDCTSYPWRSSVAPIMDRTWGSSSTTRMRAALGVRPAVPATLARGCGGSFCDSRFPECNATLQPSLHLRRSQIGGEFKFRGGNRTRLDQANSAALAASIQARLFDLAEVRSLPMQTLSRWIQHRIAGLNSRRTR